MIYYSNNNNNTKISKVILVFSLLFLGNKK